jgi:hypothetical protein
LPAWNKRIRIWGRLTNIHELLGDGMVPEIRK